MPSLTPLNYFDASKMLQTPHRGLNGVKIANNTRMRRTTSPTCAASIAICLHSTDVVTFSPSEIRLDSGGYRSVTTLDRIRTYAPGSVLVSEGKWYVRTQAARSLAQASPYLYGWVNDHTGRKTNGPAHREALKQGLLIPFRDQIKLDTEGFAL